MEMTYSDLMYAWIDKLSDQWRDWRKRKEHTACLNGMEVCESMIKNELANHAYFQKREMLLRHELNLPIKEETKA